MDFIPRSPSLPQPAAGLRHLCALALALAAAPPIPARAGTAREAPAAALAFVTTRFSTEVVGLPVTYEKIVIAGGGTPYSVALAGGVLPPGVLLVQYYGDWTLNGTPAAAGDYPVTLRVTDAYGEGVVRSFTVSVASPPAPARWTRRGVPGLGVWAKAISPDFGNDRTLFVTGSAGEIWRSSDEGASWTRLEVDPARLDANFTAIELSPTYSQLSTANPEAQTVFVLSPQIGVYKSVDHGNTFTAVNNGLGCTGIPCIPGYTRLYVSPNYAADRRLWVVGRSYYIARSSTDGGASWVAFSLPGSSTLLALSPSFGTDRVMFAWNVGNPLYRSVNYGASWYQIPNWYVSGVSSLVFSPDFAADQTVVVRYANSFLVSRDAGDTFKPAAAATPASCYFPADANVAAFRRPAAAPLWFVYCGYGGSNFPAAGAGAFYESDDAFATIVKTNRLYTEPGYAVSGVAMIVRAASAGAPVIFASDGARDSDATPSGSVPGRLYRSDDRGFSFQPVPVPDALLGVVGTIASGDALFAGNGDPSSGPFLHTQYGAAGQFARLQSPLASAPGSGSLGAGNLQAGAMSPDYATDRLSFWPGYRSGDDGMAFAAWNNRPSQFAFAPGFAAGAGTLYAAMDYRLQKSVDGGVAFTPVATTNANCPLQYGSYIPVFGVAVSPGFGIAGDQTLFAGITGSPSGAQGGVCKSLDGGATWTQSLPGGMKSAGKLFISPGYREGGAAGTPAKTIFALVDMRYSGASRWQFFRSSDGGLTWSEPVVLPDNLYPEVALSPNFALDGTVFIGLSNRANSAMHAPGGILRSGDFGATFAPLAAGDELKGRMVAGIHPLPGFDGRNTANSSALAATTGSGLWRSDDGGRSFHPTARNNLLPADVRAVHKETVTGLLAVGTADRGVYLSDDEGASFRFAGDGLPRGVPVRAVRVEKQSNNTYFVVWGAVAGRGIYYFTCYYLACSFRSWTSVAAYSSGTYAAFATDDLYRFALREDGYSLRAPLSSSSYDTWTQLTWGGPAGPLADLVALDYNGAAGPLLPFAPGSGPSAPQAVAAPLWALSKSGGPLFSMNHGDSWMAPATVPAGQVWSAILTLGVNAASGGRELLIGSSAGLWRSRDGGASWQSLSGAGSGLEATSKQVTGLATATNPAGGTDLLVSLAGETNGGVYLSNDGGLTWRAINDGYAAGALAVQSLAVANCPGCVARLYSGGPSSGLQVRALPAGAAPAVSGACFGATSCACAALSGAGPAAGGQSFKLCGTAFKSGMAIEFDGLAAAAGGCVFSGAQPDGSYTSVACAAATPAHAAGGVVLRVRNLDGRSGDFAPGYTYFQATGRASDLRVTKSGADARLTWICATCASPPATVYRGQNPPLTAGVVSYNGGTTGSFLNSGAVLDPASYFWSVE